MKLTCKICNKTFQKPTEISAKQALSMHMGRVHSGKIKNDLSSLSKEDRNARLADQARERRNRKKMMKQQVHIEVKYCPCCGFNLQVLAQAIAVTQRI